MRVAPSSHSFCALRALLEKRTPLLVPLIERCRECSLGCPCQCEGNGAELSARLQLRTLRQLLRDRLDLMELTQLNRDAWISLQEHISDPFPPIDGEGLEGESDGLKNIEAGAVVLYLLARDLFPVQVPPMGTTHEKAVCSSEERGIHEQIDWFLLCNDLTGSACMCIEVFAKRLRIFAVAMSEILVRLSTRGVVVIRFLYPLLFLLVPPHKLTTADSAAKLLTT